MLKPGKAEVAEHEKGEWVEELEAGKTRRFRGRFQNFKERGDQEVIHQPGEAKAIIYYISPKVTKLIFGFKWGAQSTSIKYIQLQFSLESITS